MRKQIKLLAIVVGVAALIVRLTLATTNGAQAQSGDASASLSPGYDLTWYSIDGGGAMNSTGGSYSLAGSIGQPDAGALSGGSYTLNGGFWGGASINYNVYLPLTLKNF